MSRVISQLVVASTAGVAVLGRQTRDHAVNGLVPQFRFGKTVDDGGYIEGTAVHEESTQIMAPKQVPWKYPYLSP